MKLFLVKAAEYQSACIAAGGAEVGRFSNHDYDVCHQNWSGCLGTLTLDARDTLICFPSDDEFDACFDSMVDGMMIGYKDTLESLILSVGFTSVSCEVGEQVTTTTNMMPDSTSRPSTDDESTTTQPTSDETFLVSTIQPSSPSNEASSFPVPTTNQPTSNEIPIGDPTTTTTLSCVVVVVYK